MNDNRRGLTSAEMLLFVLMSGVRAGAGVSRFAAMRDTARAAVMVDDLRKLAASEEAYFADHATYYGGTVPSTGLAFMPSAGVTLTIVSAGAKGWSATAATIGSRKRCMAVFGENEPVDSARTETQATCAR